MAACYVNFLLLSYQAVPNIYKIGMPVALLKKSHRTSSRIVWIHAATLHAVHIRSILILSFHIGVVLDLPSRFLIVVFRCVSIVLSASLIVSHPLNLTYSEPSRQLACYKLTIRFSSLHHFLQPFVASCLSIYSTHSVIKHTHLLLECDTV